MRDPGLLFEATWVPGQRCNIRMLHRARDKPGSTLAVPDRDTPAGLLDRVACDREIDDLLEGELLVRLDVADVDAVLVGPFGALAHEALVDRQHAALGDH